MSDERTYSEEMQAATLRELGEIRYRLGWIIVLLLTPAIIVAMALVIGLFAGLL